MSGRVVTIGNAMVDVVARVPALPQRGGDVLAGGGGLEVGGGGYRACVAARAAGADTVYAGRIGTGPLGDRVVQALAARGIAAPLPRVPDADTGFVLTMLEPDGERTFATVPGAESAPLGLDPDLLRPGDHLHVHGYGLTVPGRAAAVADVVAALPDDVVVAFDPGPFGADADPGALMRILTRADWWSGNRAESRAATGLDRGDAAAQVLAATVRVGAVVRDGPAGCTVALRHGGPTRIDAPRVAAVDTNGAGDTHVGTFLAALVAGADPLVAARQANDAAARFVSVRGSGVPVAVSPDPRTPGQTAADSRSAR